MEGTILPHSLAIQKSTHEVLKAHLFPGNDLEHAAIMLCHLGKGLRGSRLMVQDLTLIPAKECEKQSASAVSWPFAKYMTPEVISQIDSAGLCVFTIHSHPSGHNHFSHIDDDNDTSLFHSIYGWFDDDRPNGSAIMMPDGNIKSRVCEQNGKFHPIETVSVIGEDIQIWKQEKPTKKIPGYGMRVSQTFGKGTFGLLRQLKVGVVGCSGTGSIVIELLARNCVGNLVLVDPDHVEEKNLNRILNTRMTDAKKGIPKVDAIKKAIKALGMGTKVDAYHADTRSSDAIEALTDCDILFGCVDSAVGRYHLDCIANAYLIPYFDVGVYLEADQRGGISHADAVAHYVHPGSKSLMDREVYTSKQVTAEQWKRDDEQYYEEQKKQGYLEGVAEDQPAVLSVNMQAACLSFNDFLARLHNFRLDRNSEFATQRFQLVQGCYLNEDAGSVTTSLFVKYLGMGEKSYLIQTLKDAKSTND